MDSPIDDWVLDPEVLFHTTPPRNHPNYFASDFGRVFVVNGEALDVVSMRDIHIYMCDYEK